MHKDKQLKLKLQQIIFLKTREKLNRILSERTGQSIEKIQQDTDRDNFLTAAEAKEYGLIDEVMEPEK